MNDKENVSPGYHGQQGAPDINEYEQRRLNMIEQNKAILKELQLTESFLHVETPKQNARKSRRDSTKQKMWKKQLFDLPRRKSKRLSDIRQKQYESCKRKMQVDSEDEENVFSCDNLGRRRSKRIMARHVKPYYGSLNSSIDSLIDTLDEDSLGSCNDSTQGNKDLCYADNV